MLRNTFPVRFFCVFFCLLCFAHRCNISHLTTFSGAGNLITKTSSACWGGGRTIWNRWTLILLFGWGLWTLFVCYFHVCLCLFSRCVFFLELQGGESMRKFWDSEHLLSENPRNSSVIMDSWSWNTVFQSYQVGAIPGCHTKTILWTKLLRSPWWKETHVSWNGSRMGGSHRSPGCNTMLMLPRAVGRRGEAA